MFGGNGEESLGGNIELTLGLPWLFIIIDGSLNRDSKSTFDLGLRFFLSLISTDTSEPKSITFGFLPPTGFSTPTLIPPPPSVFFVENTSLFESTNVTSITGPPSGVSGESVVIESELILHPLYLRFSKDNPW